MLRKALPVLAWLLLAGIVFATLSPIAWRPTTGLSPDVERLVSFVAVGFLFALAYPRRILLVLLLVAGTAVILEAGQLLIPSRHGRELDLAVKLAGGAAGFVLGTLIMSLRRRDARPLADSSSTH